MIGMKVSQKNMVDLAERDFELKQPLGNTPTNIKKQILSAGLNQNARAKSSHRREGRSSPQKGYLEFFFLCSKRR